MNQHKAGGAQKRQSSYLPVLLCFLPLLAINIGYAIFTGIDLYWQKHEQQELAHQEIEALAAGSDFSYQFSTLAGEFAKQFKGLAEADLKTDKFSRSLEERAEKIFRWPFPQHEIFVFEVPEKGGSGELLFMKTDLMQSKRALIRVFSHLIKVNKGEEVGGAVDKQNEKLVAKIIGGKLNSDVIAKTQRGKTSFSSYRFFPHWFLWEYFEIPGKGTYGFFLFSRSNEASNNSGKLLALRDLRKRRHGMGAFVPLFKGFGGAVTQEPLNRSEIFRNWAKTKISLVENDLKTWLENGLPPVAELGKYQAYSFLGKGHTHLTVLLLPSVRAPPRPIWLFLFNSCFAGLLLLFLIRGTLLGQWPTISLKLRFIITYLLAATLPISLLIISVYGYVTQYRRATHFQTISRLQFCIKQFDARKAQIHDAYRAAFSEVTNDQELRQILVAKGSDSVEARDRVLSFFYGKAGQLPLLSFAIFDENGEGIRFYGGKGKSELAKKREADPTIEAFKYPIVSLLRRKILAYDPQKNFSELKVTSIQKTSVEAYKSMTTFDLIVEVDKRRSFPITRQVGAITASQIHELITVDGREKFAIFLVWDDQALDDKTFKQSEDHFGLNNPEFAFVAFRVTPQGLNYLVEPGRHISSDADFLTHARALANQAKFRGSYAGKQYENLSLVAMPSKKYDNTIIVGGTRHFALETSVLNRLLLLTVVLIFAIIVVLLCSYLSARIILDPITGLRSALAQVSSGKLGIEIVSKSRDELGLLCREFTTMTSGLRDREKLATLISAQAVEAITRSDSGGKMIAGDSFRGVALVSDIRNFTGICEEHSPDDVTELLNEHFAQMSKIISENGGRIYKFIGDAIEAVFPDEDNAAESSSAKAFNAASLMLIKLMQINRQRGRNKQFRYRIGVGLAYGQMYSGSVGSMETRLDYAIIGEPLKKAARLESFSTINPAFPLIIDESIATSLNEKGLKFSQVENSGSLKAFSLHELGNQAVEDLPVAQVITDREASIPEEETGRRIVEAGGDSGLSAISSFMLGAFLVGLVFAGILFGRHVSREANFESEKVAAASGNLRLIEQLKCDSVARVGFEANCFQINAAIEDDMALETTLDKAGLVATVREKIAAVPANEGRPIRYAVFLFDRMLVDERNNASASLLVAEGWRDSYMQAMKKEVEFRRNLDWQPWNVSVRSEVSPILMGMFGNQIARPMLHREFFGRVVEITDEGIPGYFYWDYLILRGPGSEHSGSRGSRTESVAGVIMLAADSEPLRGSLPLILNSYSGSSKNIALFDATGKGSYSRNFPAEIASQIEKGGFINVNEKYLTNEDEIVVAGQKYRLLICHLFGLQAEFSNFSLALILLGIALVLLWFWLRTVQGRTVVNRSLTAKLWLSLLVSAVIPLVTVFFVFGLFLNEDYNVRESKERSETQRFIDLFELRESFADPLAWKFIKERTYSDEMMQVAQSLSVASAPETFARLTKLINSWYYEHAALDPMIINFNPRDVAVAGKTGWEYATSGKDKNEANNFGIMLKQIAKGLVKGRQQGRQQGETVEGVDTDAFQGEMVIETGLQTVRSLFGDDVSVKLSHGVGLPVLMHVLSGTAGMIIYPVPGIENPEYVMVWMVLFEYENYLSRIAASYRGKYLVFPVEMHRYGVINRSGLQSGRHDLVKMASWISSSNLPVSGRIKYDDRWFLLEGRPGITQITSMQMALTPEQPLRDEIARNRIIFSLLFAVSLVMILIIARNVANDILEPVKSLITGMQLVGRENFSYHIASERSDELGELCRAFDRMMRGLEEKKMMGRMLSRNAQKFSLQEGDATNSKAEFAFLYIGIPTFDAWMSGSSPESLFADLKNQVTLISSTIIEAGGDVDKIIGEKILAVFHVDNDPAASVKAACQASMQIMMAEARGQLPFPVAIGVNFGSVITGFLGVGEKRDFTVIGDAVNVTARIEGLAETLRYQRCLLSEKIIELMPADFVVREYGEVELKGKSVPMKVFQLSV